ncbi:unnamed protein product [Orchesella dallaii]|uniref:RRM domain-containing protein n=1 Tax=Orchesella dallaii TaxID=48710 RepID=A0ABP1QW76_9HEXA
MDFCAASNFSSMDESSPKTIYVGNLDPQMTQDLLLALCVQYGPIKSCKLIKEGLGEPFAFIEYEDPQAAQMAISAMTGRMCFGRKMKLNWALPNGSTKEKVDTSKHFHIFVGDLATETTEDDLIKSFSPFGIISDCRVVRDLHTSKSKNYGFISFVSRDSAELAINQMNGYWLGSRSIRTNWAIRKPYDSGLVHAPKRERKPSYDEVSSRAGPENSTVFCGKVGVAISDSLLDKIFSPYGTIMEIRVFQEKGYGFVKFLEKPSAVRAIMALNETEIQGERIKVSWGKEMPGSSTTSTTSAAHESNYYYPSYLNSSTNPYYQAYAGMSYWGHPQGYQNQYSMPMQQQYYQQYPPASQQQVHYNYPTSGAPIMTSTGGGKQKASQIRGGSTNGTKSATSAQNSGPQHQQQCSFPPQSITHVAGKSNA